MTPHMNVPIVALALSRLLTAQRAVMLLRNQSKLSKMFGIAGPLMRMVKQVTVQVSVLIFRKSFSAHKSNALVINRPMSKLLWA